MKRIISIVFLLFFYQYSFAQKDKIINYRDYVTAKMVGIYLADYVKSPKPENIKVSIFNADKASFTKIKPIFDGNSKEKPLSLEELSKLLDDNNFKGTNQSFVPKVKEIDVINKDRIIDEIYKIECKITKDANCVKEKENFKQELKSILIASPVNPQNQQAAPPPTQLPPPPLSKLDSTLLQYQQDISNLTKELSEFKGFYSLHINLLFIVITTIFLLFFILLFAKIIQLNNRLDRHREVIDSLNSSKTGSISNFQATPSDMKQIKEKIRDLEYAQKEIKDKIQELNKKPQNIEPNYKNPPQENRIISDQQNITKQETTIFYMTSPSGEIFHSNSKSDDYKRGFAMYKFYLQYSKSESLFEFISDDETIKMVRNNEMGVIRPACKMENDPTQNTSKVITTEKGIARLEGDNWKIIKKATIKFE